MHQLIGDGDADAQRLFAGLHRRCGSGAHRHRPRLEQRRRAFFLDRDRAAEPDAGSLRVSFSLPPGSYATSVLEQLGAVTDAAAPVAAGR